MTRAIALFFSQLKSFELHNASRFARTSSRPSRRRATGASTAASSFAIRGRLLIHAFASTHAPKPSFVFVSSFFLLKKKYRKTFRDLVADGAERLERALAVLGRLHGDAEHADHREAAVLELGGLQLEESLLGGGVRELEGVEVAAGVRALLRVELCAGFFFGGWKSSENTKHFFRARFFTRSDARAVDRRT